MESRRNETELNILDLSFRYKQPHTYSEDFCVIQRHMNERFQDVTNINEVVSCFRIGILTDYTQNIMAGDINQGDLCGEFFFPLWMLLALIPKEEGRSLTVGHICLTKIKREQGVRIRPSDVEIPPFIRDREIGKGILIVRNLTVVCTAKFGEQGGEMRSVCNVKNLRRELSSLGNITINRCKLKVIFTLSSVTYDSHLKTFLCNLRSLVHQQQDELKLVLSDENDARGLIGVNYITENELEDLDIDIPQLQDDYMSPHSMYGSLYNRMPNFCPSQALFKELTVSNILIATLGYGFGNIIKDRMSIELQGVKYEKNFVSDTAPVYNCADFTSSNIINIVTNSTSSFVVCQTTYCDGTIANGATSKAINWLREKWEEEWSKEYDNLVVLIPYGGTYRVDEMEAITRATDEGIIIVCAAGSNGKNVVFPAALGNVISVGVAEIGPKGREIDMCIDFSKYSVQLHESDVPDSGTAAAYITGLLSILLSRINSILKSPISQLLSMADAIKKVPGYLHNCVVRELLMTEGSGQHDPRHGYGDGVNIIRKLISMDDSTLLQRLANVLLIDPVSENPQQSLPDDSSGVYQEAREKLYHDLTGDGVTIAVLDCDSNVNYTNDESVQHGPSEQTTITLFENPDDSTKVIESHGAWCATVVKSLCPKAIVKCVNNLETNELSPGFYDCADPDLSIDIISYSFSSPYFDLNLCQAVNEAIIADKIVVFAAGNSGQRTRNTIGYPGRIGNIIVVGGRDLYHNRIDFSFIGRELDFLANADLGHLRGTSFAAPTVAGFIAFLLQFIKQMDIKGKTVTAWSVNPDTNQYEWRPISIFKAAHNVYAMRFLLKELLIAKPQDHSEKDGFGSLDFSQLFPCYCFENAKEFTTSVAENLICSKLQKFYK